LVKSLVDLAATELINTLRERVILLPIASLESHGPLPLGTDILFAECVCHRLSDSIVVAPVIPFSTSIEHAFESFAVYTMSDTFLSYLRQVLISLAQLRRPIIVVPFHGGVRGVAYHAAREAMFVERGVRIVLVDPFKVIDSVLSRKGLRGIVHADPVEASILLACGYKGTSIDRCSIGTSVEGFEKVLEPWIGSDIANRYRSKKVCGDEALGREIVNAVVLEIERTAKTLLRSVSEQEE